MQTYPPGTRIGQYEIASRPMMGGMGVVYFALDHGDDGRPVALKTFRPELLPNREARDRFLREGTAWVDLGSHPHIVRCYKVQYIDPTAFLSLELIAKEQGMNDASLRSWLIPGQALPVGQSLLFALQIARGMQHACAKIPGFVHRDLKPENLLVGADKWADTQVNRLRVTDFGLAAILQGEGGWLEEEEGAESLGRTHLTRGIVGTPLYMAPEQWRGETTGVYTDVYALGCILFEMLCGGRAAPGGSLAQLQEAHCSGKIQPIPSSLPDEVRALLAKCLALEPAQRYGEWAELTELIERTYAKQSGESAPRAMDAIELSREERMQVGRSYNDMGVAYKDMGKAQVTAGYFEKALSIARKIGDRNGEGVALGNLGNTYMNLGDARRAIGYHEQALVILREIGDRHGQGATLGNLGNTYMNLGDARRAIGYNEQYLAITHEIGDRRGQGNALGNLGNTYMNLGDVRRAIGYYEQRMEIAREIGDRRGEGAVLGNLGVAYSILGDARRAIEYYEQALVILREIGDRRGEGDTLGDLGSAYLILGDVRRAIGYYEQALVITREIGDRRGQGAALGNLGLAYADLGDARRAIDYHEQGLEINREIGDRREEGADLGNLGNAYADLGDAQRAIEYYEQGLAIAREIGNLSGVAAVSLNMALLLARQGETDRALPLAREAAQAYAQIGHPEYTQRAQQLVDQLQGASPA